MFLKTNCLSISQFDSLFFQCGIIGLVLSQFENRVPLKLVLGRGQCCTITLLHMNRLNNTESAIFLSLMCSLHPDLPEDLHLELI